MRFASGARLGPFEILAPLGAGGMGEVYRARDTRLDRTVAIKLLPSELVNAPGRRVERFRHEARAIARITHPNICTLHDVGEDGSAIFLVMEYVDGMTLARRLEDGPLPLPLALRTAIGIADALDHAHRHGVVHRDLKPSNVMLTRDSVKLLDFGLAKLKERDEQAPTDATRSARLTDVGTIVGTVPYMAPEQIEGREVDARTDIFSFGVVLYEMVCGRRPFAGDSRASLMAAIVAAEPPPLSSLQPQIPASLERLIRRCLAKDPDDRWQTARDLAAELRWIAEAGSGTATALPAMTRRPRRAALWGAVAGAALTAAVFAAAVPSMWPRPAVAEYRPVTFRKGVVSSARFTPDGQSFVYSASWEGQPYAAFLGRRGRPRCARSSVERRANPVDLPSGRHGRAVRPSEHRHARSASARWRASRWLAGHAATCSPEWWTPIGFPEPMRSPSSATPGAAVPGPSSFQPGTTVHEARAAWSLRVSPDGSRVAFFEGPVLFGSRAAGDDHGDRQVRPQVNRHAGLGRLWIGVGAVGNGDLVHGHAPRPMHAPHLHAVSLSGVERTVHRAPDWLVLHDISADGRVLLSRNTIRIGLACRQPGDTRERDLTWLAGFVPSAHCHQTARQ